MTKTRTDIHRPSFLDPAEYREVGYADLHEDGFCWMEPGLDDGNTFDGNFMERGRCDHCGAGPLRYVVFFLHAPTGQIVSVGERCATVLGLSSKSERTRRAEHETARRRAARQTWLDAAPENQECYDFLNEAIEDGNYGYGGFYHDLLHKLNRWGELSEKQVAAALRGRDRDREFAAKREAEAALLVDVDPLVEGRYLIEGEVLSHKWTEDTGYGSQHKMLVRLDNGNKVWGTVAAAIEDALDTSWDTGEYVYGQRIELKGQRVSFTAKVERSEDDPHFGFYSRPTKPALIKEVS